LKRKAEAEARKAEAEARKAEEEARLLSYQADLGAVTAAAGVRKEQELLASDKYNHVYMLNDMINATSVKACIEQLTLWSRLSPGCAIDIIINSPGGSVIDGMMLFDFIQSLRRKGHYITTYAMGYAASMAGILLQAGDRRIMGKESYVLIHEISTGAIGKIGEIEDVVEFVKKIQERVLKIFESRSNKSAAYFEKHWRRKDWWLSSDECLAIGIVDEVQ
jgi:ATP-dependent Clp endopeptidase proteolytic subunit ClpP